MNRYRKILLVCIAAATFFVFSGRRMLPVILENIEVSLGINHAGIGIGLTLLWVFYGLMQFPSGILSDEKGRKTVIMFAILTFSLAYFFMALTFNYVTFLFVLIILGIGCGSFQSVSISMLSDTFKKGRGKALAVQSAAGSLAGVAAFIAPLFTTMLGWRELFLIWAAGSFLIGYIFNRYVGNEKQDAPSRKEGIQKGIQTFSDTNVLFLFGINVAISFSWIGITSFFPIYLIEEKQLSPEYAGALFSLLFLAGMLIQPFMGHLSDKYNKKTLILSLLFIAALSCFLLPYASSLLTLTVIAITLALIPSFYPIRSSYLMEKWSSKNRGARVGMYQTVIVLFSSPAPAIIGYAIDHSGFNTVFIALSLLLLSTALLTLSVKIVHQVNRVKEEAH